MGALGTVWRYVNAFSLGYEGPEVLAVIGGRVGSGCLARIADCFS